MPVPRTIVDWALEVLALASLVSLLGLVAGYWTQLPERIPTHFGASGRPDGWGGRSMLLLLPLVTLVMYGTLTLVGQFRSTSTTPGGSPRRTPWRSTVRPDVFSPASS
ncbi:MAG: DUF1648 domain-containing protein [Candidatus Eisenbacteria bacterium]|nr:DUF1648 domain-containing protein [Candidatus Eisenbacteria bacterium]